MFVVACLFAFVCVCFAGCMMRWLLLLVFMIAPLFCFKPVCVRLVVFVVFVYLFVLLV